MFFKTVVNELSPGATLRRGQRKLAADLPEAGADEARAIAAKGLAFHPDFLFAQQHHTLVEHPSQLAFIATLVGGCAAWQQEGTEQQHNQNPGRQLQDRCGCSLHDWFGVYQAMGLFEVLLTPRPARLSGEMTNPACEFWRPMAGPLVHAHRGGAGLAPENTMAAFRNSVALGAHCIELDVRLCASGELVVVHDEDLRRVAGLEARVAELPMAELKSLDVGSHFSAEFAGESIPCLVEVLEELGQETLFNIEVKEESLLGDGTSARLGPLLSSMGLEQRCLVSSFNPGALLRVARDCSAVLALLYPTEGAGRLKDRLSARPWLARALPVVAINPHYESVSPKLVSCAHRRGLGVNAWTVNQAAVMAEQLHMGVDGLITDRPDLALELLL